MGFLDLKDVGDRLEAEPSEAGEDLGVAPSVFEGVGSGCV